MAQQHAFEGNLNWSGGSRKDEHGKLRLSRSYTLRFKDKAPIEGSSPAAFNGDDSRHNPETLMVASLMACHHLTYLAVCERAGIEVLEYSDSATGTLAIKDGKMRMVEVVLWPEVRIADAAQMEQARELHAKAHANCFMSNSVNFEVKVQVDGDRMTDRLRIGAREFGSRLLLGTGKYRDFEQTRAAVEASGAEIITLAIRRTNIGQNKGEPSLLEEVPLGWDAVGYFQYNVENVVVDKSKTPWSVKVIFSVTDPSAAGNPPWDIKMSGPPFKCNALTLPACPTPGPSPSLTIDIGWNTAESVNTGSRFNPATGAFDLGPVFVNATNNRGLGAALPIRINALSSAIPCASASDCPGVPDIYRRFRVSSPLPPALIGAVQTGMVGSGTVGIEGHPVWPPEGPTENVPVRSTVAYFPITSPSSVPRRQVVDFDTKCSNCHDGEKHGDTVVPTY